MPCHHDMAAEDSIALKKCRDRLAFFDRKKPFDDGVTFPVEILRQAPPIDIVDALVHVR